jgi:retron-type reverse transcriptase
MVTHDIKDVYVNISIRETIEITKNSPKNDKQTTDQIITILKLSSNRIIYHFKLYHSEKGIAMGSPISGTIAEIFLQHIEDKHIKQILDP